MTTTLQKRRTAKRSAAKRSKPSSTQPMVSVVVDLPRGWKAETLGSVLHEVDVRVSDLPPSKQNLEVLSLTKNHGLIPQSVRFGKRIATDDVGKYKVVHHGQIVYNPYVIWEGAVHALRRREDGIVSPVYPVCEPKEPDGGFLDFLLRTPPLIEAYNRLCSGAVNRRRSIRVEAFLGIEIPIPSLLERSEIAGTLNSVRSALEACERVIVAARQLKAGLLKHLFTYGPVPHSESPRVETVDTTLGALSLHWRVKPLGDFVRSAQYGLSKRGAPAGQYPILRMNNVQDGKVVIENVSGGIQFVDLPTREFEKFRLEPDDLLFNRTNSIDLVGKTALSQLEGDFVFASYLIRLQVDGERLDPAYLNYYLNMSSTQARLKTLASRGVSQSNINATKLKGFEIPVAPMVEQREIVAILNAVDRKIEDEKSRRASLERLFQSMLHHLMTGKVRLPEFAKEPMI